MSTTNRNLNWKKINKPNEPILLAPAGKDYLWGGERLKEEYHKDFPELTPLAETWECSTHPDGVSIVASGEYAGRSLADVLEKHPEWLGTHPNVVNGLPVLVKLIDADKDLSIQVHPDDAYAREHEAQAGKTEMWYVLEAQEDASLVYGFSHDIEKEEVLAGIEAGTIVNHLNTVKVKKDDVFMLYPGTVHAIGRGILLAEVQQCSNVTYRLFDYDRVDKNGQKRPLHVEKALEVLNRKEQAYVRPKMHITRFMKGSACESLCRCEYFQVDRVLVSSQYGGIVENTSFQIFLIISGKMCIDGLDVKKGDCVFLPAGYGQCTVNGKGALLKICC